jgi:quercetin dioxygenase-like cupin family protein
MTELPTQFVELAEQPHSVELAIVDGLFVKTMEVQKAGTYIPQHSHRYDHASVLARGSVRIWQDGELMGEFRAPKIITIKAGAKHTFLTLEDNTLVLCIHNVSRSDAVEIADEHHLNTVEVG